MPDLFGFNFTINIVVEKKNHTSEIVYEIEVRHREREEKKEKSEKNIHIVGSPVRSSEYLIEYGPLKAYFFLNTISSCESEWSGFRQEMQQKQL